MHICCIEIENFRGIRSASLLLKPHTVLLGPNNVGKSAVVDAIALLLGRDRLVRNLGEYDFFGGRPQPQDRIRLRAVVTGFATNEPSDFPQWFNISVGATPGWWDPAVGKIEPDQAQERQLAMQIGFAARFNEDDLEVPTLRYFVDGDGDAFEDPNISTLKAAHLTELGFFLLPASRTWNRTVSFGSELFRKVLRFQDAIPGAAVIRMRDWLRNPTEKIEDDGALKEIVNRVNGELASFVGEDGAGLTFRPTTGDIEGVLAALTPHLLGKGEKVALPIERHGSGVISLQTLMLLLEFGNARRKKDENFILAAEEPELHLHPGHHRHLVARIRSVSNQSVTTTHSPEIAAYYRPEEILLLSGDTMGDVTGRSLATATPAENALMRIFTIYRAELCNALMHRVVVVPEGFTEFRWFNGLLRVCSGQAESELAEEKSELVRLGFGVIPTQDAKVVATYEALRLAAPLVVPLVDGDGAGDGYVKQLVLLDPAFVLQMPSGMTLEGLVASFVWKGLSNEADWVALSQTLGEEITGRDLASLVTFLIERKSKWDIHEALLGWLASRPVALRAARYFLESISSIVQSGAPKGWQPDPSSANLFRWVPESEGAAGSGC